MNNEVRDGERVVNRTDGTPGSSKSKMQDRRHAAAYNVVGPPNIDKTFIGGGRTTLSAFLCYDCNNRCRCSFLTAETGTQRSIGKCTIVFVAGSSLSEVTSSMSTSEALNGEIALFTVFTLERQTLYAPTNMPCSSSRC